MNILGMGGLVAELHVSAWFDHYDVFVWCHVKEKVYARKYGNFGELMGILAEECYIVPEICQKAYQEAVLKVLHFVSLLFHYLHTCEIWGFHDGKDDEVVVLGFGAVDSTVDASVSEKYTVSIFRAD
jgi:hypothetical protein